MPWNLHEPRKDEFDFGSGDNDMSQFLDIVSYLKIAQEEDLFVIIRPGPYICAEWEFGGLPSWLLSDKTMHVRTMYEGYRQRFVKYFEQLMPLLSNLQFTNDHGPIIAIQVTSLIIKFHQNQTFQPNQFLFKSRLKTSMAILDMVITHAIKITYDIL